MRLSPLLPQEEPLLQTIARAWHRDVLVMVRDRLPRVAIALLLLFILQRIVHLLIARLQRLAEARAASPRRAAQLRTIATTLRAAAYGILGLFAFLQILTLFNIAYGPLLASAGILGVGVGLGAQSLFKDVINGVFILAEDQFNVGETVRVASLQGTVESLSLRATTLRDPDGTLYIIPNSQIATVANLSRDFSAGTLTISVDATSNPDQVLDLLRKLAAELLEDPAFQNILQGQPEVPGIADIRGREVFYPITFRAAASQRDGILRELRRRVILAFDRESIPLGSFAERCSLNKVQ